MTIPPVSNKSRSGKQNKIFRAVCTIIALIGLIWLLDYIGWQVIASYILRLGWKGVAVLLALGFMESIFDAASLRAATMERISYLRVLSINQAGALMNTFIPWEAGEVLKGRLLYNHVSSKAAITRTVVWNYIFKISKPLAALTAAGTGWFFVSDAYKSTALMIMAASIVAFIPYFFMRILLFFGPASLIVRLAKKLRIIRYKDSNELLNSAREIDATVKNFWKDSPSSYLKVFLLQYCARIVAWITVFAALCYLASAAKFSFPFCGTIYAGLSVMTYLVLLLPTRMGTTEGSGYLLFALLGLNPAMGLTLQLVLRLKAISTSVIPAAFVLLEKKSHRPSARISHTASSRNTGDARGCKAHDGRAGENRDGENRDSDLF